jgi:hypothetical protein
MSFADAVFHVVVVNKLSQIAANSGQQRGYDSYDRTPKIPKESNWRIPTRKEWRQAIYGALIFPGLPVCWLFCWSFCHWLIG